MSRDTHVPADSGVRPGGNGNGRVDRAAWALEIAKMLESEADGNKAALARLVRVDRKTVFRWLAGSVDVSEESVRQVARALGRPVGEILVKVGIVAAHDLLTVTEAPREDAAAMRVIEGAAVEPALRRGLVAHLRTTRREHERQRFADIERLVGLLGGRRR